MTVNTIQSVSTKEEFNSFLTKGMPVKITGIVPQWPAYNEYSMKYLCARYANTKLSCKIDGQRQQMTMQQLSDELEKCESDNCFSPQMPLFNHNNIGKDTDIDSKMCPPLDWITHFNEANIWIGKGTTPLHYDGYDNLLAVIEGEKKLILFPPEAMQFADVRGQWSQLGPQDLLKKFPQHFEITVKPGELLYLPAYWFHEVSVPGTNAISINYWYHEQYGQAGSHLLPLVKHSVEHVAHLAAALNDAEKGHFVRVMEDVIGQLKNNRYPISESEKTWSHRDKSSSFRLPNF